MNQFIGLAILTLGVAFAVIGSIGIHRLPDFYTRAHAASKPDTLGLMLSMLGLAVFLGWTLSSVKLLLMLGFVAIGNPTATHALGRAAIRSGIVPWTRPGEERS